ncbi:MAG TPA: metal ABC transporter permease [Ktedonobacterales bacterium]|nr:metal ABC transporter permease [Ktedonobacterales bacterium]
MTTGAGITLLSAIPPFSPNLIADARAMLGFDFMRYALLAGTVIALVAGLVSFFIVLRHQTFAGDALADVAFAGALGAAVLSVNLLVGLFGGTVAVALGIGLLGGRARARDVAIGTVLAWVLGLGVLFLTIYTSTVSSSNGTIGVNVLFGTIFGLTAQQASLVAWVGAGALALLLFIARPLLFASLDPEVAAARGVPLRALSLAFLVLVGVTVAEAVQTVGALLIFSLLVAPGAVAQRLVTRPFVALALSAALALAFTWIGLAIAFYTPYPASFLISTLAFGTYLLALLARQIRGFWTRRRRLRPQTAGSGPA